MLSLPVLPFVFEQLCSCCSNGFPKSPCDSLIGALFGWNQNLFGISLTKHICVGISPGVYIYSGQPTNSLPPLFSFPLLSTFFLITSKTKNYKHWKAFHLSFFSSSPFFIYAVFQIPPCFSIQTKNSPTEREGGGNGQNIYPWISPEIFVTKMVPGRENIRVMVAYETSSAYFLRPSVRLSVVIVVWQFAVVRLFCFPRSICLIVSQWANESYFQWQESHSAKLVTGHWRIHSSYICIFVVVFRDLLAPSFISKDHWIIKL